MRKIKEKDGNLIKVIKLVFGFRENPEFLFRTLKFLDDIRISTMNYAIQERQKVFDKIDNSFYYFIANNLFNNLTFTNSKDDEFLSVIFRLLKEQINEKYDHFLEKNSVLSNIFKAMLIQIDMKEKFKEILQEILFKMEELSDEEWLLDIHDINKFIYELKLKEKKGPITQKVRNIFLEKRKDILKQDERLFRKFIKYKVKDLIDDNYEEKYYNTRGIITKINSLFQKKKEDGKIENEEPKYDISNFYEEMKKSSNQKLAINVYRHYFLIVRKILHIIIDTLISKMTFIPNNIKCICKMIEILGKNSYYRSLTNFDINVLIGKFIFENIINYFLFDERYIPLLDFFPVSTYAKKNFDLIKLIFSNLQSGNLFSLDNNPNLIPFNSLFINELFPKLFNFYHSLTQEDFSDYIKNLVSGKIKEYDFSYNFFEINPDDIFRNMSICFNINNYHSFLTLFKSYTFDSRDRKDFYKRGDKNCINNMRQYFGSSSDYKEFTNFTNQNQNKNPNIFHLYYKNISKDFDLGNEKNDSQIVFSIPEKNLQEIESQEEYKENEIIKMKNLLCLLLWKANNININDFSENNFYFIIQKLIHISKEEIIGGTLNLL